MSSTGGYRHFCIILEFRNSFPGNSPVNLTLNQMYRQLRERLEPVTHSAEQATTEADWLIQHVLGISPGERYVEGEQPLPEEKVEQLLNLLSLRTEKRIPIQYLLHEAWFFGLSFYVNPHVLIPRPETELLVEQVLTRAKPGFRILDVGTGPGVIAISLASRLKQDCDIVATDLSPQALVVARLNQKRHSAWVDFRDPGDLFAPLRADERFELIVSNPPYIDPALKPTLVPEVLWYEPAMALFPPGEDAYYFYRRLASEGKRHLQPGGVLLMEVGAGMGDTVREILVHEGYRNVEIILDYAGLDRIVQGILSA